MSAPGLSLHVGSRSHSPCADRSGGGALSRDVGVLSGEAGVLSGEVGVLSGEVGALSRDVGVLSGNVSLDPHVIQLASPTPPNP